MVCENLVFECSIKLNQIKCKNKCNKNDVQMIKLTVKKVLTESDYFLVLQIEICIYF